MNLEEAEKIIFTAVGLYTSQRVPPKKRRKKFENPLPQVLRTAAEVKVRPSFRVPEELEANAARLTALDAKFSQPYKVSEKTKGFYRKRKRLQSAPRIKAFGKKKRTISTLCLKSASPKFLSNGFLSCSAAVILRENYPTLSVEECKNFLPAKPKNKRARRRSWRNDADRKNRRCA